MRQVQFALGATCALAALVIVSIQDCVLVGHVHSLAHHPLVQEAPATSGVNHAVAKSRSPPLLLEPVAAFEEWKRYHTREAVLAHPHNRTYMIGTYSCPRLAGNMLVEFQNALLLAIVTNRTLLWQYRNRGMNSKGLNPYDLCHTLVERADWLPSYDEFKPRLPKAVTIAKENLGHLRSAEMYAKVDRLERVHTDVSRHTVLQLEPWMTATSSVEELYFGTFNLPNRHAAAYFGQMLNLPHLSDMTVVKRLYSEGLAFLYGMLLQKTLPFTKELLHQVHDDWQPPPGVDMTNEISIAIHSRHNQDADDGSVITREENCIRNILQQHHHHAQGQQPCALYVMSDREETVAGIEHLATTLQCRVVKATQPQKEQGSFTENGPFAGAGFFLDLAVVSHARTGFVGMMRSSSALVDELMEYQRRTEAWEATGKRLETSLTRCYFQDVT